LIAEPPMEANGATIYTTVARLPIGDLNHPYPAIPATACSTVWRDGT